MAMKQLKVGSESSGTNITPRESEALNRYLQEISKIPQISPQQEVMLAQARDNGDETAVEKLAKANLRFVVSVAKKYQYLGLSLSDLINEGNLGLLTAAKRFDETRGFKFISYAVRWIRQAILEALGEQKLVRLPANKSGLHTKIYNAHISLQQTYEREPSTEELADFLEITEEEIDSSLVIGQRVKSLDAPIGDEPDSDLLYEVTADTSSDIVDSHTDSDFIRDGIVGAINTLLNPKQKDVIRLFFGIGGAEPMSLEDIGDKLSISPERARQIKEKAIQKLKEKAGDNMYDFFAKTAGGGAHSTFGAIYSGTESETPLSLKEQVKNIKAQPTATLEEQIKSLDMSETEKKYAIHCLIRKDPLIEECMHENMEFMLEVSKAQSKARELLLEKKHSASKVEKPDSHIIPQKFTGPSISDLNNLYAKPSSATPLRANIMTTGENIATIIPQKQDITEIGYTINDTNADKVTGGKVSAYFSHLFTRHSIREKIIVGVLQIAEHMLIKDTSTRHSLCYLSAFKKISDISSENIFYITHELLKTKNECLTYRAEPEGKPVTIPIFSSIIVHRAKKHATPLIEFSLSIEMRNLLLHPESLYKPKQDEIVTTVTSSNTNGYKHTHTSTILHFLQNHLHQEVCYTSAELRNMWHMTNIYEGNITGFIMNVIEPALREIESKTDLRIHISHKKFYAHDTHVIFQIGTKDKVFKPKVYNVSQILAETLASAEERIQSIPMYIANKSEKNVLRHFFVQADNNVQRLMQNNPDFHTYAINVAKKIKIFLDKKYGNSIVSDPDSEIIKKEKRTYKKRVIEDNSLTTIAIPLGTDTSKEDTWSKKLDMLGFTPFEKKIAMHLFIKQDEEIAPHLDTTAGRVRGIATRIKEALEVVELENSIPKDTIDNLYALLSSHKESTAYRFEEIKTLFGKSWNKEKFRLAIDAINMLMNTHFSYSYSIQDNELMIVISRHDMDNMKGKINVDTTTIANDKGATPPEKALEDIISELPIKKEDKQFALHLFVTNNPISEGLMRDNIVFYEFMIELSEKISRLLREKGINVYIRKELVGINALINKQKRGDDEKPLTTVVSDTEEKRNLIKSLGLAQFNEQSSLYFLVERDESFAAQLQEDGAFDIAKKLAQQAINHIFDTQRKILYMIP